MNFIKKSLLIMLTLCFVLGIYGCQNNISTEISVDTDKKGDSPDYIVESPDGNIKFKFYIIEKRPYYSIDYKGSEMYETALLGLEIENVDYSKNVEFKGGKVSSVKNTFALNGRVSLVSDFYTNGILSLKSNNITYYIDVRVYNSGVAFRTRFPKAAGTTVNAEYTSFKVNENSYVYASFGCRRSDCQRGNHMANYSGICYESIYERFSVKDRFYPTSNQDELHGLHENCNNPEEYILTPMTIEFPQSVYGKQYYGAILEGNLSDYVGINLRQVSGGLFEMNTTYQPGKQFVEFSVTSNSVVTPYRILTIAEDLSELYSNTIVYSVNECTLNDYSWVVPGKSTWSWRSNKGTGSITTMQQYSNAAAKMGFDYNVIDSGWAEFKTKTKTPLHYLENLCNSTSPYDVKQIVWNGFTCGGQYRYNLGYKDSVLSKGVCIYNVDYDAIERFCKDMARIGVKGLKLDFFAPEDQITGGVNIYEKTAAIAANYKLIINYHGSGKPSGLNITQPNILNYEAIFGHEMGAANSSSEVESKLFTTQYLTRGLAGHADYTPHVQNGLGWAELVFVDSPLNVIDATPEELLNSPAKEFIKACPTTWDSTKVLSNSKFGEFGAIAKKNGENWFLGVINSGDSTTSTIKLSEFLEDNGSYFLELYTDNGVSTHTVTPNDTLTVELAAHSGYAARISKVSMSSYGGEITSEPITLNMVEDGYTAYYTTDGSDPANSKTRRTYDNGIKLDESCDLEIVVKNKSGDIVSKLSYRFNKM